MKIRHRALRVLIAFLVLLGLALGAAYWLLSGSLATLDGHLVRQGPAQAVTLDRDALGTLTVEGHNRRDVAWGLGFAHGQERFFQMDLLRRVAAGELSALVGGAAIEVDTRHRMHRLRDVAEHAYAALPDEQRALVDAYRDGVNAGLDGLRVCPWEYLLLRQRPQPWRSEDSLLVIGAMYFDLNDDGDNRRELDIARLRAALPTSVADTLLAPDPRWEAPMDGSTSPEASLPGADVIDLRKADTVAAITPIALDRMPGSNSFAVSGAHTTDGSALVANDMHLDLRVPGIWYRARLRYPDASAPNGMRDLNGVTLPGTPALVAGSNGRVAWAFTNSYGDWSDWVRVERDPNDPTRYRGKNGWETLAVHDETIDVAGGEPRHLRVEDTRWGPLIERDVDGTPLALAWVAQLPRAFTLGVMGLEQANDVDAALAVAPRGGMPPQNFIVGDSGGRIAWTIVTDTIPLRTKGQPGWTGFADAAAYPRIVDPAEGRLWTANNRVLGGEGLALLGNDGHDQGARAQQIRDDLRARERLTPAEMLGIQLDDRAVFLERWYGLLRNTLDKSDDASLAGLKAASARWSGHAAVDSVDYRIVRDFRHNVREAVLAPFISRASARFADFQWPRGAEAEGAIWTMLHTRPMNLLDPRWQDWDALLLAAAKKTATTLGERSGGLAARTWGEANTAHIVHPLSAALPGWLGNFLDMPADPLPGDVDMPRVQGPRFGASERFGISPGHEDHSYLEMPGGQSGHPLSPFHGAGHEDWVHGRPTPLLPGPARYHLVIEPRG